MDYPQVISRRVAGRPQGAAPREKEFALQRDALNTRAADSLE